MTEKQLHEKFIVEQLIYAEKLSKQSTCIRRQVGAAVTYGFVRIGEGVNAVPEGHVNCTKETCYRFINNIPSGHEVAMCYCIHAEQNAIMDTLVNGKRSTFSFTNMCCTHMPCGVCLKLMIGFRFEKVYFLNGYPDPMTKSIMLKEINAKKRVYKPIELIHVDISDINNPKFRTLTKEDYI